MQQLYPMSETLLRQVIINEFENNSKSLNQAIISYIYPQVYEQSL